MNSNKTGFKRKKYFKGQTKLKSPRIEFQVTQQLLSSTFQVIDQLNHQGQRTPDVLR